LTLSPLAAILRLDEHSHVRLVLLAFSSLRPVRGRWRIVPVCLPFTNQ
jgi:hypothetical protein